MNRRLRFSLVNLPFVIFVFFIFLVSSASSQITNFPLVDNSDLLRRYGFTQQKAGEFEEIALRSDYHELTLHEGNFAKEQEKLAVVVRGYQNLYPYFDSYMLAFLADPLTAKIAAEIKSHTHDKTQVAPNIAYWSRKYLLHTQQTAVFRNQPGSDPWGAAPNGRPLYKKAIPSEMLAKSMFTGKLTGKCEALPSLIAALFVLNGAKLDDVVILRLREHNIGLVRFDGTLYLLNNQTVTSVDEDRKRWIEAQTYYGFSSYSIAFYRELGFGKHEFVVSDEFLKDTGHSLLENFLEQTGTLGNYTRGHAIVPKEITSAEQAQSLLYSSAKAPERAKSLIMARYASQSLYVENPEIYLQASLRAPRTLELAKNLNTREEIFQWMKDHIRYGSIFQDSREKLMTADEVILFRQGSFKDQAVLAWALLKLHGSGPKISLTSHRAFVTLDHEIYEAGNWNKTPSVTEPVLLELN